jgi:hypothetical protein
MDTKDIRYSASSTVFGGLDWIEVTMHVTSAECAATVLIMPLDKARDLLNILSAVVERGELHRTERNGIK